MATYVLVNLAYPGASLALPWSWLSLDISHTFVLVRVPSMSELNDVYGWGGGMGCVCVEGPCRSPKSCTKYMDVC